LATSASNSEIFEPLAAMFNGVFEIGGGSSETIDTSESESLMNFELLMD
jgi:hypothetical protein